MFEFISSRLKLVKYKFDQYQVFLGEDRLQFITIFLFAVIFILQIPFKIVILFICKYIDVFHNKFKHYFGSQMSNKTKKTKKPKKSQKTKILDKKEVPLQNQQRNQLIQVKQRIYSENPKIVETKKVQQIKEQYEEIKKYFQPRKLSKGHFNLFTPISLNDPDRLRFAMIFQRYKKLLAFDPNELKLDCKESRAVGVMLGMAINDALGANMEFQPYSKQGYKIIINGFQDIQEAIEYKRLTNLRINEIGIWTDDASMGLVMGYALMMNNYEFNPMKMREMFHLWWYHGLGNGGRQESVGLGGNISIAIEEFTEPHASDYTAKGDEDRNGNGSLMRLAPIPIVFHQDPNKASKFAALQSLTTHNGLEAKECCRLMNEIIIDLINRKEDEDWNDVFLKTCDNFKSEIKSVECLAKGEKETDEIFNQQKYKIPNFDVYNQTLMDRKWNWRELEFEYSPTRLKHNANYIGSYCMDALAMALHVVYFTASFKEIAVKIADKGGDCDTVGAIAGQIAGAIYGVNKEVLKLYSEMVDFKQGRYEVFLVGYSLYHKKEINLNLEESHKKSSDQKKLIKNKKGA